MKGAMNKVWKKASAQTHSVASTYKTERKIKELIGPPRPAALVTKIPVILNDEGRVIHPRVWTVMQTGPGQEMVAVAQLKQFGYGAYCPVITKWSRSGALKRIRHFPLFPRYIFVSVPEEPSRSLNACSWGKPISTSNHGDMPLFSGEDIYVVSDAQAAGVYDEAKSEAERFAEFERLKDRCRQGDRVKMNDDLWGEIDATVVHRSPSDRITLLMNILGRATKVTVALDQIRPAA